MEYWHRILQLFAYSIGKVIKKSGSIKKVFLSGYNKNKDIIEGLTLLRNTIYEEASLGEAIVLGAQVEAKMATMIFDVLGKLFTKEGMSQVGGPVAMYRAADTFASQGFFMYCYYLAMISINLGIVNLLPLPALLNAEEREQIFYKNAAKLFGLKL